jgi:tetratricopeptide (TPR) repeat protein
VPPPASTRSAIAAPPSASVPAQVPAVPPAVPPAVVPVRSVAAEVRQLTAIIEKMRSQDYFELFGLKRDADASAVKGAYFRLAKSYHPDTVPAGTPADIARLKADIFALIGQANRTLSEANLKAEYLAELAAGGTGEKINIASLLQAEEFFQKGCILVKVKKFGEAVRQLDDAIKANASEGEYYGWRGWAKFFTFEDKVKGHLEAMRDIEHSLRLNPNAAAVHFFQGYLWKLKGELVKAKACFKRCVELDPRHVDAQRELRTTK